jgi:DNA polymerase I-like protein with 3'-5' exonuclease and polymerase domains
MVLGAMEARGVGLDCGLLRRFTARVERRLAALRHQAVAAAGGVAFNPASAAQLSEVLFTRLKLPQPQQAAGELEHFAVFSLMYCNP